MGKTDIWVSSQFSRWKHPHACGEDCLSGGEISGDGETPPRLWGRLLLLRLLLLAARNTPTPVGKTSRSRAGYQHTRKHPHACGEDSASVNILISPPETPPRLWGRQRRDLKLDHELGNTPTPVGKTSGSLSAVATIEKHPHACGEDHRLTRPVTTSSETPPRLWGRPVSEHLNDAMDRNTPTPVGKTEYHHPDQDQ